MPGLKDRSANLLGKKSNKRKLSQLIEEDASSSSTLAGEETYNEPRTKDWDTEQDYETRGARSLNKKRDVKQNLRLPIRTADGGIVAVEAPVVEEETKVEGGEQSDVEGDDGDLTVFTEELMEVDAKKKEPRIPERQRILLAKEELARSASIIIEDPEKNAGQLKKLKDMFNGDNSATVKKLVVATQLSIFRDIIPGYRIRPLTVEEQAAKVTRDVKRLRAFENSLVLTYQDYVNTLAYLARAPRKAPSKDANELSQVAITCACSLLSTVPHFNFRTELLKIVVERMSVRTIDDSFIKCRESVETLFRDDDSGTSSLEAVRVIVKMLKAKEYVVHESVLNTFLSLRLLSELDVKASWDTVENPWKIKKKERVPWSKKERKLQKEKKVIDAQMKAADAVVHHEEREKMQSETLKLVFVTYFRILKEKREGLMAATLEGLAKFAHLINVDFFGNILEALKDLISEAEEDTETTDEARNATRESLLCIATAFALLSGQTSDVSGSVTLDLTFFTTHLYASLLELSASPTIEFSSKSLQLPDPSLPYYAIHHRRVDVATEIEMLLRSLDAIFFKNIRGTGAVPSVRVAAFLKRLYISALQLPEKSSIAVLSVLAKLVKMHYRKLGPMFSSEDRVGDGLYDAFAGEAEFANPMATSVVWESVLLEKHYSPKVRDGAKNVLKGLQPAN